MSRTCWPASSTAAAAPLAGTAAGAAAAGPLAAAGKSVNLPFLSTCFRKGMKEMPIMNGWSTSGTLQRLTAALVFFCVECEHDLLVHGRLTAEARDWLCMQLISAIVLNSVPS